MTARVFAEDAREGYGGLIIVRPRSLSRESENALLIREHEVIFSPPLTHYIK